MNILNPPLSTATILTSMKMACFALFITIVACGDRTKENTSASTQSNHAAAGSWKANGAHVMGYKQGKYSIALDLNSDGTCKMAVQFDLNKTAITDKFSDIIQLEGTWTGENGKVKLSLKVKDWVVTDLADYRKQESFDDFVTHYNFKIVGEQLTVDSFYKDIKIGTTEEARDMDKMTVKGKGIILPNVEFLKK